MTYKITTEDQGRSLILEIDNDSTEGDIERAVESIYSWRRERLKAADRELYELKTRPEFCAWCWRQHENGAKAPQIAKSVNAAIADLVREFVKRTRPIDAAVDGERGRPQSLELMLFTAKQGIDAGEVGQQAERLLMLARPRTKAEDLQGWMETALNRIRQGDSAFIHPLLPVDPDSISRAIQQHRRIRGDC